MTDCPHKNYALRKRITKNRGIQVGWWCTDCCSFFLNEYESGRWVSHKGLDLDKIPTVSAAEKETCQRCEQLSFGENHHYGPREIFGYEDAENWPQGFLCNECHEEWHEKMGHPIRKRRTD